MCKLGSLKRRDYTCTLKVLSPLHIGSGRIRDDILPDQEENGKLRPVPVNAIIRGTEDKPYLPGTTLKGALRAASEAVAIELFGDIKREGGGQMGALLVRGALIKTHGQAEGLPYATDDGVFVLSRTAIDAGRGIAAHNKLFNMEAVAPGATFDVQLRLETRGDIEGLENALIDILSRFSVAHGRSIGADAASGFGRVRVTGDVTRTLWEETKSGALNSLAADVVTLRTVTASNTQELGLECDGPFLTRDSGWTDEARAEAEKKGVKHPPHLRGLRHGTGDSVVPFVTGQTVSGAMRARLEWLLACDALRKKEQMPKPIEGISGPKEIDTLSPSERLFGVTGWKGVLNVAVTETKRAQSCQTTSVRIDRFSGGTIDNALFTIDADLGVSLTVQVSLDGRANDEDQKLLCCLRKDLTANGLKLGHGSVRGFGWFKVRENANGTH